MCGRRAVRAGIFPAMRAVDIQHIGTELAIKWDDGREDFIPLEQLRRCWKGVSPAQSHICEQVSVFKRERALDIVIL